MKPKHLPAVAVVNVLRSFGYEPVFEPHRRDVVTYADGGRIHQILAPASSKHPEAYAAKKVAHLRRKLGEVRV